MMDKTNDALAASRRPGVDTDASADKLLLLAHKALEDAHSEDMLQRAHPDHAELSQQAWLNVPGDTLNFSHQNASSLSVQVIELIKDRVERLALSHNTQIHLPNELALCSRLFYLNLRWNSFTSFPESILLLSNLQTLDLSRNDLTSIPEDLSRMTSLKFLAITDNKVSRLPLCIGEMTSLTRLKIENNPIEYPPPEDFEPSPEARNRNGFESNTFVCGQVKRFMRREKERQRSAAESEMSEGNLETPRPLRRTNTGRFPVRPSGGYTASGPNHHANGSVGSVSLDTRMMGEPPRFNAGQLSQNPSRENLYIQPTRRPGLSPVATTQNNNNNRSRSETVAGNGPRLKRHGWVPLRKTSGPPSANSLNYQTTRPTHLRTASYAGADEDDQTRSSTMSPNEAPRRPWLSRSRLSSLPEDRRVSKITSPAIRSARLLVYSLDQLNRPMDDVIRVLRSESPRPSTAERLLINATQNLKELDAQLHILTPMTEHQNPESKDIRQILKRSRYCVQAYNQVIAELRQRSRDLVVRGDPMYLRGLMLQIFNCLVEVRNACAIQEATAVPPQTSRFSNVSQARSDHTVTPTQPRATPKPLRGARIMADMRRESPTSAHFSSGFASSASSINGTVSSASLATPRSGESLIPTASSTYSSNYSNYSTQMTSPFLFDSDEERQFERIYISLKMVCDLADHSLFSCRQDLFVRKEGAARSMSSTGARAWSLALIKCDALMHAFDQLKRKMAKVRVNDPAKGRRKDFWLACDGVFNAWFDLASEMKVLGTQGLDIASIKVPLRSLQKAIKDASRMVAAAPVVKKSYDQGGGGGGGRPPVTALLHHQNMPPTPLSAALGPAAQATVPNTPGLASGFSSPADSWHGNGRYEERERSDTVNSRYGATLRAK